MSKMKIIVRKVASPYSDKSGYAAEFLLKNGNRSFVAEWFGKELSKDEEQLAKPLDLAHLIGYSYIYAQKNGHRTSKSIQTYGAACWTFARKIDKVKEEISTIRKERNKYAQYVLDITRAKNDRKYELTESDEEVKAHFASLEATLENRIKVTTPIFDEYKSNLAALVRVYGESLEEHTAEICGYTERKVLLRERLANVARLADESKKINASKRKQASK